MAGSAVTPPPGFELEDQPQQDSITPPEGFELEPQSFEIPSVGLGAKSHIVPLPPPVSEAQKQAARESLTSQYTQELTGQARQLGKVAATVAPALTGGMSLAGQSAITGLSGAAQSALGGGTGKETAISGGIGLALPFVGAGLGKLYSGIKSALSTDAVKTATTKALQEAEAGVSEASSASATALKQNTAALQDKLQGSIRDVAESVAKENGVKPSQAASIRDVLEETGDQIYAKSKSQYAQIDAATGGRFQRFSDALKRIDRQIQEVADIDVEKEGKLIERRNEIQDSLDKTFEDAKAAGLDPKLTDEANSNFKKSMAFYDVDRELNTSTSGFRKGIGSDRSQTPEIVDPKGFGKKLEKLYKTGRLEEALGPQRADELYAMTDHTHASTEAEKAAHEARLDAIKKSGAEKAEGIKAESEKQIKKIEFRKKVAIAGVSAATGTAAVELGKSAVKDVIKSGQ